MVFTRHSYIPFIIICLCSACIDRITIDTGTLAAYPVVIDGFISNEPGPYLVKVTTAYDIGSKSSIRLPISVKQMFISDNHGTNEKLREFNQGYYYTNTIQGVIGRVYTIRIELLDGRVYESFPDTLLASGKVDDVYFTFRTDANEDGSPKYGFDVFFDSSAGDLDHYNFLWKFTGTYQADIECCHCYPYLTNSVPIVSDNQFIQEGHFKGVKASYVPVTGWTFQHKVHAEVSQMSLTRQSFDFWRGVRTQLNGINSLFQPITGKIPDNFTQLNGPQTTMQGLFYATAITRNAVFIYPSDVPNPNFIPKLELSPPTANYDPSKNTCTGTFPNSTTIKPSYWGD